MFWNCRSLKSKGINQTLFICLLVEHFFGFVFILQPSFDLRLVVLQMNGPQQSVIAVGSTEEKGQGVQHIYRAEETSMISQSPC